MPSPEAWLCAAIDAASNLQTYPLFAPDGAEFPYVIYQRLSTSRRKLLSDASVAPFASFGVQIYAESYSAAKDVADLVRLAVDNFNGTAGGLTIASVEITDERDGDAVFFDGRDTAVYVIEQTYTIEWEE
jgi:hypothetical protein